MVKALPRLDLRGCALLLLCLAASPAVAVDSDLEAELQASIELTQARARIRAQDYAGAMALLEQARERQPASADVESLLGFASRKLGRLAAAHAHYRAALALDPEHLGAHEYLGELHLIEGDRAAAEALLARLEQLCPAGCEERDELAAAIRGAGERAEDAP